MSQSRWIVPYGADETVYIVVDRCDRPGGLSCEIERERAGLDAIIAELLAGQFSDPLRILAYNTLEHWSEDISANVVLEIESRCDDVGRILQENDVRMRGLQPPDDRLGVVARDAVHDKDLGQVLRIVLSDDRAKATLDELLLVPYGHDDRDNRIRHRQRLP